MDAGTATTIPVTPRTQRVLRRDNVIAALVHLVQAVAVLALATGFALPVTASYLEGPPGTAPQDPVRLFDIPTGPPWLPSWRSRRGARGGLHRVVAALRR